MVQKVNPIYKPMVARSFLGKSLTEFNVTVLTNFNDTTQLGPEGAVDRVIKVLSKRATIAMISALTGTGFTFFVEGEFPNDDYDKDGSATLETFASLFQADIRAIGTVDGSGSTASVLTGGVVAVGATYYADQVNP